MGIRNFYHEQQLQNLNSEIKQQQKLSDSLSANFDLKSKTQSWLFGEMNKTFKLVNDDKFTFNERTVWDTLIARAKRDNLEAYWNNRWKTNFTPLFKKLGYRNCNDFKSFVLSNIIETTDRSNKKTSLQKLGIIQNFQEQQEHIKSRVTSTDEMLHFAAYAMLISLIVLFVLRYIIYGIIWSIKTLKG